MAASGTSDFERLARVLERHLSPMNARSVLRQSLSEHNLTSTHFKLGDLRAINGSLERGLRLFTTESVSSRALRDIAGLTSTNGHVEPVEPRTIGIDVEPDISRARAAARQMCEQTSAKGFAVQKVTTIVSELARNIVSYTNGGKIELALKPGARPRMVIRSIDHGPGIANIEHILSGQYVSKTGLGRGIVGTKRLADFFDIKTSSTGTHIVAEVDL